MKKVSAKKVFAIIGIVISSVTAFVGAVVGVMALMGKFKTPNVYPTTLEFAITEQTVIEQNPFDVNLFKETGKWAQGSTIYSFTLSGTNSKEDHEVNKKDCYIWFENVSSSTLITLCNKQGKPLTKDNNNRYLVKCNEPIYYMVNALDEDIAVGETDGKVTLMARSTNETLKRPENPMVIWIDRTIESVFVDNWGSVTEGETVNEQEITVGVEIPFDFEYAVETPLSISPIAKESAKEIELYYNVEGMGYVTDYVKVTKEEVDNVSSPLHSILTYNDEGVFTFRANSANPSTHLFYIAVFKTYQAKIDYEKSIEGITLEQPNYHRLTSLNNDGSLNMSITNLTVIVKDTDVSQVGLEGTNLVLDLYQENTVYIHDETKDNNLGLYMLRGDFGNTVEDTSRFDEVDFALMSDHINSSKIPEFENDELEKLVVNANTRYSYTNIYIGENLQIVDYAYKDGDESDKYYCSNGVAVVNTYGTQTIADDDVTMLDTGSYLNFFIKKESDEVGVPTSYRPASFDFKAEVDGRGVDKMWTITSTSMQDLMEGESLVVGILVVNNKGSFVWNNFFRTLPVTLNPIAIDAEYLSTSKDFEITFAENKINYPELAFAEFINIKSGSYNACVLVAPKKDSEGNDLTQIVETIEGITFNIAGKDYVLVGYIDEDTGKFVNAVKVNENVSNLNQTCNLYMLQLKNEFEQTVNDIIDPVLGEVVELGDKDTNSKIVELHNQTITISAKYILNTDLLSYVYYDVYDIENDVFEETKKDGEYYTVYENTENHTIVLSSLNAQMIENIVGFYSIDETFFNVEYENVIITSVTLSEDKTHLLIKYSLGACLSDDQTPIEMKLENAGAEFSLGRLKVLSGSPEVIVFNYAVFNHGVVDVDSLVLFSDETSDTEVLNSTDYLKIIVGYKDGGYTYKICVVIDGVEIYMKWELEEIGEYEPGIQDLFNTQTMPVPEGHTALGFQDQEDKGQTLPISYDSTNLSIFNTNNFALKNYKNLVEQSGTVILSVKIGSTTGYLKLITDTSAFAISTKDNKTNFDEKLTELELRDILTLTHIETAKEIVLSEENLVKLNDVKCVEYGDGLLETIFNEDESKWELRKFIRTDLGAGPNGEDVDVYDTILEIKNDETVGWKFKKFNSHINLTISFIAQTIAGNVNIQLTFSSNISISVNDNWEDNRVLYAGTKVQLLKGEFDNANNIYLFDNNAVFNVIKQAGDESVITFKVKEATQGLYFNNVINDSNPTNVTYDIKDAHIGNIIIEVLINGTSIHGFDFVVMPNVIATKKDVVLESERTSENSNAYSINELYDLRAYDMSKIYGSDENTFYTDVTYYTDNTYAEISDKETEFFRFTHSVERGLEGLSLSVNNKENLDPVLVGGSTLSIGQMAKLNFTTTRKINLEYNSYKVRTNDEFEVENKFSAQLSYDHSEVSNKLVFKALETYNSFASVVLGENSTSFVLKQISANGLDIDVSLDGATFKINTILEQVLEDVDVDLTFEHNGQTLIYETTITIIPYTPNVRKNTVQAYSGSTYDLLNGIYNADDFANDKNISKLLVTGIYNETKTKTITNDLIVNFVESGYTYGHSEPNCEVVFKEISKNQPLVQVEYKITYVNAKTFTYYIPLTIKNRQTLTIHYPESDNAFENGEFKFFDEFKEDALTISGLDKESASGVYQVSTMPYEAVAIYTNESTILTFDGDEIKKVARSIVKNEANAQTTNGKSTDITIELIGYQNNPGMLSYIQGRVNKSINQIELPYSIRQGLMGMLIFKITTVSGNSSYYNIYIYCKGEKTSNNINVSNNLEVIYHENSISYLDASTGLKNYVVKTNNDATTYLGLVSALGSDYAETFKRTYTSTDTKVYLYEGVRTGEDAEHSFEYNQKRWKKLSDSDLIPVDAYFNKITLGLMLNKSFEQYCYGTITIYVQPKNEVKIESADELLKKKISNLNYELPNGQFTADVDASALSIACPFKGSWNAEIVSVDGKAYELTNAVYSYSGAMVTMTQHAPKDTEIVVKYANSATGTIVFVTYTYKATVIPEQTSAPTYIGQFENETVGFVKTINLASEENLSKFFGTYATTSDYTITENDDNCEVDGTTLTFTQTYEEQIIDVTITYTDFGSTDKSRKFTFRVLPGVYLDTTSSSETSGLTNVRRTSTKSTEKYDGSVGSELSIDKTMVTGKYTKYEVAGLKIYTDIASKLELSFDVPGYLDSSANTIVSDDYDIPFVHSAQEMPIDMKIKVLNSSEENTYAERNLYIKVVQTYSSLKPVYLVSGADHENVQSYSMDGSNKVATKIDNLHSELLGSKRFVLLDHSGKVINSANLSAMGFVTGGNPNFINFSVPANASIKTQYGADGTTIVSQGITFNSVARNTMCQVYLNNNAGLIPNGVIYNYQIMAGDLLDGLDYTSTNGYNATNETDSYISFATEDREDYSKTAFTSQQFVIGSMLDEENDGVFSIIIDEVVITAKPKTISEGKYVLSTNADGSYVYDTQTVVGDYYYAKQYNIQKNGYNLYITFDIDTRNIELIVNRPKSIKNQNYLTITLGAGGVNGGSTLIDGLTIVVSNHQIEEEFADKYDTSIYSGYLINLFEDSDSDGKLDNGKFIENGGESPELTYELTDSSYNISGKEYVIQRNQRSNSLFVYDETARSMEILAVGQTVTANVNFLVKKDGYIIDKVTYKFYVYVNFQIVANGEELVDNRNNETLETYFVLTNKDEETSAFSLERKFKTKQDMTDKNKESGSQNDYYNVLVLDLYRLEHQFIKNPTDKDLLVSNTNIEVMPYSNIDESILTISNSGITFKKDFTGEFELKLSVPTDNGTYSVIWTIYVTGLLTLEQTVVEPITNSTLPYESGEKVDIIKQNSESDVAIVSSTSNYFDDMVDFSDIKATYNYKVISNTAETRAMTNEELYEISSSDPHYFGEATGTLQIKDISSSLVLPSVPSTMADNSDQSYFVVFEVSVDYLNQTQKFYVAYSVINRQKVETYKYGSAQDLKYSANVNVDNRVYALEDKYYLDLFYYSENLTTQTKTYKLIYSNNDVVLSDGSQTYTSTNDNSEQVKLFTSTSTKIKYKYRVGDRMLSVDDNDDNMFTEVGVLSQQQYNYDNGYYSVFDSKFKNIYTFRDFIDIYLDKESVKLTNSINSYENTFKLVEIDSGRYGIDLYEERKSFFNNELRAELAMMSNSVKTIVVQPYSAENPQGFRIYSDCFIKAKTNEGEGVKLSTMFLPTYIKANYFKTLDTEVDENKTYYVYVDNLGEYREPLEPNKDHLNSYYELITVEEIMQLGIIGVGAPSDAWVENGTIGNNNPGTKIGEIQIPKDNAGGYNTYYVMAIKYQYKGKDIIGKDKFYNLTQIYYYIDLNGNSGLFTPDYSAVGIETTFYKLTYAPDQNGYVTLDLNKAVREWYVDSTFELTYKYGEVSAVLNSDNDKDLNVNPIFYNEELGVYAQKEHLIACKLRDPNYQNASTNARIVVGDVQLGCKIEFALPTEIELEATYSGGTSDILVRYTKGSSNASMSIKDWKTIVDDYGYVKYDNSKDELYLNGNMVDYYFKTNPTAIKLVIENCIATNENGVETTFIFIVSKSQS